MPVLDAAGMVVAIDGPVGSGKSTVARAVAERLGLDHLETGAMYRAVAFAAIQTGLDPTRPGTTGADLARLAAAIDLEVGTRVFLHEIDVTEELRSPEVNRAASAVATHPSVRSELVRRQRQWAQLHGGGVIEGRDIGSVVFPDATLKVFLTASESERARRRQTDEDAGDLARRDQSDSTRAVSPLVVAEDAVIIDTTGRGIDDIVEQIVSHLEEALPNGSRP
ncbi:MAG: (d)CMP kinase [Acidimicrobiales bacterium]